MGALSVRTRLPGAFVRGVHSRGGTFLMLGGLLCAMICVPRGASAQREPRLFAAVPLGKPPTAADVVARMSANAIVPESYTVPVHVDAKVHRLITLHFGMNGTVYYKRPDHLALAMSHVPSGFRKLFAELGNAQTWASTYDMTFVDALGGGSSGEIYRLKGVPKQDGDVDHVLLDLSAADLTPQHASWLCRDGSTIDMTFLNEPFGGYELAKRAEADMVLSGWKIHAVMDYGPYVLNETITQGVFSDH
jgi:hypothetical protein